LRFAELLGMDVILFAQKLLHVCQNTQPKNMSLVENFLKAT